MEHANCDCGFGDKFYVKILIDTGQGITFTSDYGRKSGRLIASGRKMVRGGTSVSISDGVSKRGVNGVNEDEA